MVSPISDRSVVLAVVYLVGAATIVLGGGALALVALGRAVPGEVWTLAGTALGGLVGMLVSTRSAPAPAAPAADAGPAAAVRGRCWAARPVSLFPRGSQTTAADMLFRPQPRPCGIVCDRCAGDAA